MGSIFDSFTSALGDVSDMDAGSFFSNWGTSATSAFDALTGGSGSGDTSTSSNTNPLTGFASNSQETAKQNSMSPTGQMGQVNSQTTMGQVQPSVKNNLQARQNPKPEQGVNPAEMELRWMSMLSVYGNIQNEVSGKYV